MFKCRYSYAGWSFTSVDVDAPMTGPNLLAACAAKGMKTPCDHPSYCDGKCVVVDYSGHLSYNNDGRRPRDLWQGKYFYAAHANQGYTLQSVDSSHRWSDAGNEYGQTLCVQRRNPKVGKPLKWNGFEFTPFLIRGAVDSPAILATCRAAGLMTPCDHPSWTNGQCVVVNPNGHMSYAAHNDFPRGPIAYTCVTPVPHCVFVTSCAGTGMPATPTGTTPSRTCPTATDGRRRATLTASPSA